MYIHFFLAENVLCFLTVLFYILLNLNYLLNLIFTALIYITFICIIFCPKGIETAIQKIFGVGGRGLAWEKQV
ncbi:MAG: hypothetical protein A2W86_00600 [Bacteroidetes bacterium GWD2_45_23]|nr:MAG: hypothetical protein A2071_04440 [Bacteroidetes bacterium GWC1_47_7]OFX86525.1 MAG: hypothetical protein A2W86_00600 [Bacteroidetes bacterium GWD2_45_23]HCC17031.1 hypothetical protein [Porphyromonadaceae bacterium]